MYVVVLFFSHRCDGAGQADRLSRSAFTVCFHGLRWLVEPIEIVRIQY